MYVVSKEYDGNSLIWFDIDKQTWLLTYKGKLVDGVNGVDGLLSPANVTVSPDDKNLYVAAHGEDALTLHSRNANTSELKFMGLIKDGINGADGLDGAYWVEVSTDGNFVYVGAQDDGGISWFARNASDGSLTYKGCIKDGSTLGGTRGLSIHPKGEFLFSSSCWSDEVSWFSINKQTGELTLKGQIKNGENGVQGIDGTRYNAISPDGSFFVASGYDNNGVAWFAWDGETLSADIESKSVEGSNIYCTCKQVYVSRCMYLCRRTKAISSGSSYLI